MMIGEQLEKELVSQETFQLFAGSTSLHSLPVLELHTEYLTPAILCSCNDALPEQSLEQMSYSIEYL